MAKTIEAVFENGVFKPLEPVDLKDGQVVQVYIPWGPASMTPEEVLEADREVQESFEQLSDEDWEEISKSWKRGS